MKKTDDVFIYNTMSRKIEKFVPLKAPHVGIYTCGPTVYNYAHIGNLRTFIFEDVLKKTLQLAGFDVYHVMNITDVGHLTGDGDDGQDKLGLEAQKEKKTVEQIALFYTKAFLDDIALLNIKPADVMPRASEHIPQMLELISRLEEKGHTYTSAGNVYFSIDTCPDYGKLARLKLDALEKGKRVGVDSAKKNPHDFALWFTKSKFENQAMKWPSPYGEGYPGWHLECSAMAQKYLGDSFDIHCGGVDAIPVHHTNEIAQSECANSKTMAKYWMHGEFLLSEKGKMSKSTGDFTTLSSLISAGLSALGYRFFCLQSHYRKQLQFTFDAVKGATVALQGLYKKIDELKKADDKASTNPVLLDEYTSQLKKALYNDLNTSVAVALLYKVISDSSLFSTDKLKFISIADSVLSLSLLSERVKCDVPDEVKALASQRQTAKSEKNYALADELRSKIMSLGYSIKDSKDGFEIEKV